MAVAKACPETEQINMLTDATTQCIWGALGSYWTGAILAYIELQERNLLQQTGLQAVHWEI